jgi:two-component system response regulator HydG
VHELRDMNGLDTLSELQPSDPPRPAAADLVASLAAPARATDTFDPTRFLRDFSAQLRPHIPHDRIVMNHLDPTGRTFTVFAEHAPPGLVLHEAHYTTRFMPQARYVVAEWGMRDVFSGQCMLVHDFPSDSRFTPPNPFERRFIDSGLRSGVFAPLLSGGRVVGTVIVTSLRPRTYGESHLALLRQVATLVGPLIENAVLLERERRRRKRLTSLTGMAKIFGPTLDIVQRFHDLAEAARPHLGFDVTGMCLPAASGRAWEVVRCLDGAEERALPEPIALEHLSFGPRLLAGEAVLLHDLGDEPHAARPGDASLLRGARSAILAPLELSQAGDGCLFFAKREANWYDESDLELAAAIAAQVVVALQHQRLAEEQQRRARIEVRARRLEQEVESMRRALGDRYGFHQILGSSPVLRDVLARAEKVAATETTVLLTGESGTGKELVARAIHCASARATGPFVAINCAALPETLLDDELFGHERGAFTGADRQKAGRFELAARGTLFLDEVGELSAGVQAKLLRVLQEREFQRVGGTETLHADVRLITATNRDLEQAVEAGHFRQDLFYRLNVFTVHLPPLRARGDDVLLLAEHFLRSLAPKIGATSPGFSPDAREALLSHAWPGNIRELQNAVERALILSDGRPLTRVQLGIPAGPPRSTAAGPLPATSGSQGPAAAHGSLPEVERRLVAEALAAAKGNKSQAARLLGLTRFQLYTRLKRFGLTDR